MALEFEAAAAAPTPPFTITGTPYYLAMFNAAGDNVADSQMFTVAGGTLIAIKQPNGTIASTFTLSNTPDVNAFSLFWTNENAYIGVASDQCMVRVASTDTSCHALIGYDKVTEIPYVSLFDAATTKTAILKNDDGLIFNVTDDSAILFNQALNDAFINISLSSLSASLTVKNGINDAVSSLETYEYSSVLTLRSDTVNSGIFGIAMDGFGNTYLSLTEDSTMFFKASAAGIETDSGNQWKFNNPESGAPTPDYKLYVEVNGTTYKIAAEQV